MGCFGSHNWGVFGGSNAPLHMVQASAVVCDGLHVVLIPLGDEITPQRVPCDRAKGSSSIPFPALRVSYAHHIVTPILHVFAT